MTPKYILLISEKSNWVNIETMRHEIDFNEGLSIISHEIKNSLSGVKLGLEELRQLPEDEGNEVVEILLDELDHLHQITMDTLTLTYPVELYIDEVDIKELIRNAASIVIGNLKANEPSISFKFDEDFPPILCDKGLMKSVFINLINNAYEEVGKNGAIEVGGKPVGNNRVEIWVADNGTGINEEINSIFMKFKSTKGGYGIGLSLVKKIVNEHFGKISVESAPHKGTKFIIEIPTDYHLIDRRSGEERREPRNRREGDK